MCIRDSLRSGGNQRPVDGRRIVGARLVTLGVGCIDVRSLREFVADHGARRPVLPARLAFRLDTRREGAVIGLLLIPAVADTRSCLLYTSRCV